MRFEFAKHWKGETFVYNSDDNILHIRKDAHVDRVTMTDRQALRLLADIVYGTVKPLSTYFEQYGRDSIGSCPRCNNREV